jgi:hypothetical protein
VEKLINNKQMKKVLFLTMALFCLSTVFAQTMTFQGEVVTNDDVEIVVSYENQQEGLVVDTVEYQAGIFGKKQDFYLYDLRQEVYTIKFSTTDFTKYCILDLTEMLYDENIKCKILLNDRCVKIRVKENVEWYYPNTRKC